MKKNLRKKTSLTLIGSIIAAGVVATIPMVSTSCSLKEDPNLYNVRLEIPYLKPLDTVWYDIIDENTIQPWWDVDVRNESWTAVDVEFKYEDNPEQLFNINLVSFKMNYSKTPEQYVDAFEIKNSYWTESVQIHFLSTDAMYRYGRDDFQLGLDYYYNGKFMKTYWINVLGQPEDHPYDLDTGTPHYKSWRVYYDLPDNQHVLVNTEDYSWMSFFNNVNSVNIPSHVVEFYDNCFNYSEEWDLHAILSPTGQFPKDTYSYMPCDYLPENPSGNAKCIFGTKDHPEIGHVKTLHIEGIDNNISGYKLQLGNPLSSKSWVKMFYKCWSLRECLHEYFDNYVIYTTPEGQTQQVEYTLTAADVDSMIDG